MLPTSWWMAERFVIFSLRYTGSTMYFSNQQMRMTIRIIGAEYLFWWQVILMVDRLLMVGCMYHAVRIRAKRARLLWSKH